MIYWFSIYLGVSNVYAQNQKKDAITEQATFTSCFRLRKLQA